MDHYEEMQYLLTNDTQICHLNGIMETRKEWAEEAHKQGKYGTAKEYAITSSLARQLKELARQLTEINEELKELNEKFSTHDKTTKTSRSTETSDLPTSS